MKIRVGRNSVEIIPRTLAGRKLVSQLDIVVTGKMRGVMELHWNGTTITRKNPSGTETIKVEPAVIDDKDDPIKSTEFTLSWQ